MPMPVRPRWMETHPDREFFLAQNVDRQQHLRRSSPRYCDQFSRMKSSCPVSESGDASIGARNASSRLPTSGAIGGRVLKKSGRAVSDISL